MPAQRLGVNRSRPVVTWVLLLLNIGMFLVQMLLERGASDIQVMVRLGAKVNALIAQGQYWRLVTPMFLHAGIAHILYNAIALLIWGPYIEALFGGVKYAVIYLLAGIAGTVASFVFSSAVSVGASGAIFGLFGTMLYIRKNNRALFNRVFGVQVLIVIALNVFSGFTQPGIDNWGHIGGLVGGFLAAYMLGIRGNRAVTLGKIIAGVLLFGWVLLGLWYGTSVLYGLPFP